MRRYTRWLVLVVALGCYFWPRPALAHDTIAVLERRQAGPYELEIGLDRDPPRTGQDLAVTVRALPDGEPVGWNGGGRVTVVAVPAYGTAGTPTRLVVLQPESHDRASYAGTIQIPVQGQWRLEIEVNGSAGPATASVPVSVAGPPAIPVWLGWLVGLSPLAGLGWFVGWNRRYLRRLVVEGGVSSG
ncbi:MAG: hypothetical protein U0893_10275 [Chloroflexota bacterium]